MFPHCPLMVAMRISRLSCLRRVVDMPVSHLVLEVGLKYSLICSTGFALWITWLLLVYQHLFLAHGTVFCPHPTISTPQSKTVVLLPVLEFGQNGLVRSTVLY